MSSLNHIDGLLERLGRHRRLLLALVVAGVLLRLLRYASNPSIWLDEAMLLKSLMGYDYGVILGTLSYDQSGPLAFLAATKLLADLTAGNAFAVRLLSCLAGCALMPVGLLAAKRLLPAAAVAPAMLLLAVSDPLIDFSAQVKPYAIDALFTLTAIYCGHRIASRDESPRHWWILGGIAVVTPWLSWGTHFGLAAAFALVFLSLSGGGASRRGMALALAMVLWLAGGVATLFMSSQWSSMQSIKISWVHKDAFAPFPPASLADLRWYPRQVLRAMAMPGGFTWRELGAGLALLGVVALIRQRAWRSLLLLCAPILLAAVASAAQAYPFRTRLLLFSGAQLSFLAAQGLVSLPGSLLNRGASRRGRAFMIALFFVAAALSLGWESGRALYHVAEPRARSQMREMVTFLKEEVDPDALVYVYYAAAPAFEFYLPDPPFRVLTGMQARYERERYSEDIDRMRGERDLWVVFSRPLRDSRGDEEAQIVDLLDGAGRQVAYYPFKHGGVYRYELTPSPPQRGAEH